MAKTKEERAEYMKQYRKEHREELNASKRYWYRLNLTRERARSRANGKIYYEKHKDDADFKQRNYANYKRWVANNRLHNNEYQRKYLARKRGLEGC